MNKRHYIIPIFVPHAGCPHDCIFCNQKKITGHMKKVTQEDVIREINTYMTTIDRENSYVELSFFGGSFTGIPMDIQNELLAPAYKALREGTIDNIRLSTRPDYIDETILNNLKQYGVGVIELGVQSMDDTVLNVAERGHTKEDVIYASNLIKSFGFTLGLQMMVGLPNDNFAKDMYTARKIIKLNPDFVRIYPALVIKGTKMEEMLYEGKYTPLSLDECIEICKELLILFILHDIKVIRLGLQATDTINEGKDVVAGPFHPSFRELVESSMLNDVLDYLLKNNTLSSNEIKIGINSRSISKLYAGHKKYFNNIKEKYKTLILNVHQDNSLDNMALSIGENSSRRILSVYDYLKLLEIEGF